ncbi:cytochrome P450 [Roridomyces roridus]|uniref:Cytochrome P450 n=1 Tax=Roridomyces roridus TaxID=1738132 RepID=A0AAD7BTG9_9AGAR|nr:cytochrome P450 [Roridomyces roridus]
MALHLFIACAKAAGALLIARGVVWLANLFLVAPRSDPLRNLPGPEASALQSHFGTVDDPDITPVLYHEWTRLFGKTFRYHGYGSHDYRVFSTDLRVISHVLNSPIYEKPWQTRSYLERLLGQGVFGMEGAEHKVLRKLIGPAFTAQAVKEMSPAFFQKAEELRDRWDALISAQSGTIDVAHWLSRTTFDIFGLAGLDYHFNALHDESEPVYSAYRQMFAISDKASQSRVLKQLYLPILEKIWPDADDKNTQRCQKIIRESGLSLIKSKRDAILAEKPDFSSGERDILSLLIKSNLSSEPSNRLSDTQLLDQITSFLFAGSDSTSLAITWCLHLLSLHPDIQNRLRAEIISGPPTSPRSSKRDSLSSVSSTSSTTSQVQVDTIDSLPYLDAVVRETLRVMPPVHGTVRVATADDLIPISHPVVLRSGKTIHANEHIRIRKGSVVHIPLEGINMAEEIWGAAAEAREFNPDRWTSLLASAKLPTLGVANVMSFSFGGHSCPGARFALIEAKVILATLLAHFVFSPVEGIEIGKFNSVLTRPFVRGKLQEDGIQLPLRVDHYVESHDDA